MVCAKIRILSSWTLSQTLIFENFVTCRRRCRQQSTDDGRQFITLTVIVYHAQCTFDNKSTIYPCNFTNVWPNTVRCCSYLWYNGSVTTLCAEYSCWSVCVWLCQTTMSVWWTMAAVMYMPHVSTLLARSGVFATRALKATALSALVSTTYLPPTVHHKPWRGL